jgi:hypothetical protein
MKMKDQINSSKNIFKKIDINTTKKSFKTDNKSKNNLIYIPDIRKIKQFNQNNIINDHSYIPKPNILKILVKHQKSGLTDDTHKIIVPLRNRICDYQNKNEIISKEIKELRSETKTFLHRYKMSGLLTPKNNSHFLKLGISDKIINDIISEGYKMTDVLNKTNIFDKSILLNKHYANFARNIIENKNPELINDSNYIMKMNESLNEKKNSDLFTHSNSLTDRKKTRRRISIYNIDFNKQKIEEETKVSVAQLINEFNIINKDLKIITNQKILKERKKREIREKEMIKESILNIKKTLSSLESDKKIGNKNKKEFPLIKKSTLENNEIKTSQKNKKINIENFNRFSLPNLILLRRKSMFNNLSKSNSIKDSTDNPLTKSFKLSTYLNKENKSDESYKNKRKNFNSIKRIKEKINSTRNIPKVNKSNFLQALSIDDLNNSNHINKTEDSKMSSKLIKSESKYEEYKKRKNHFLQNLYNNIKIKRFNENKNDISDYLRIYKGASIKEPNYEKGSQIYNLINEFIKKTKEYNLPNEINKIRNKTNMFSYKRSRKFEEILKLNNKVHNLIYDYAEDILDLNNDIKK